MRSTFQILCVIPVVLLVVACKEDEPNHTVQYFQDNDLAREEMLATCEVMDGAVSDANCVNANAAAQTIAREKNRANERDAVKSLYGDGS